MEYNKYIFQRYNDNYKQLYKEEEEKLKNILDNDIRIEHCGSTAVPGLGGKGIIDIIIGTDSSLIHEISRKLQNSLYKYIPSGGNRDRLFFQYDYPGIILRRVHIHLVELDKYEWISKISLRNFLIKYRKMSQEYEELKKRAVNLAKGDKEIYREAKKDFLDKLTSEAIKEYE